VVLADRIDSWVAAFLIEPAHVKNLEHEVLTVSVASICSSLR